MDYPTSRDEARRAREKFYFTGKPCRQGHTALRYTHNMACAKCSEIHQKDVCDRRRVQKGAAKAIGRLSACWRPTIVVPK